MRNKIFTLIAILTIASLYYFSISAFKKENNIKAESPIVMTSFTKDTFTNCIFNCSFDEINSPTWNLGEQLHVGRNLERYTELNFNAVHSYDEVGSENYGRPDADLTIVQKSNYKDFLDSVRYFGNFYGFFERSHLSKYCYGQRLIYEVPEHPDDTTTNYGFVYKNSYRGTHEIDEGRTVIHAYQGYQDSGYLCKDIYENLQHSDLFNFRQNDKGMWYLKPVMKIPVNTPGSTRVVRIEIVPFGGGEPVRQISIKAENFSGTGYVEKYNYLLQDLNISGADNPASLNKNRGDDGGWLQWDTACHIDFRVFWYGECDVWFDKMIVDDEKANVLFDPSYQSAIDYRIQQEVENFTNHGSLYTFFTDEVFISQTSCIKYVVDKMRSFNPTPRFSLAVTNNGAIVGLKNDFLGHKIYLDSIKPDFLQDDHHGIQVGIPFGILKIPTTVPITDSKIPSTWIASSNYDYNKQLQDTTIGGKNDGSRTNYVGSLIYELRTVRDDITQYSTSTKFIMQPQIHGWITPENNELFYKSGNREPLNEEIQVQAMVSIAHGANGLCWFTYNSHIYKDNNQNPTLYMIGLLDPINNFSKRENNCYGQNKWQYVSNMNEKILNWAPTLENTNWSEGYSVHQEGANHNFIYDIRSKVPYINGLNPCADFGGSSEYFDCLEERYWEQGFYTPKDQTDKSKYFVMVNRRCVPPTQSTVGEVRTLKIKFNTLPDFNNWILKDVNTGQQITFDKNNMGQDGYLNLGDNAGDLGYFQPGEGKLFKLVPVMQEGGTLVCNEEIGSGIQSFECKGEVIGNNKNISIPNKVTISFHPAGKITMNGGDFTCGLNTQSRNDIIFQGTGTFY